MTDDDVVPLEDDDVWATFDDDFDDGQQTNVITSTVLPPNLMHPSVGTFGSNMMQASFVNVMLLALGQ
jgi:hypothetical protein